MQHTNKLEHAGLGPRRQMGALEKEKGVQDKSNEKFGTETVKELQDGRGGMGDQERDVQRENRRGAGEEEREKAEKKKSTFEGEVGRDVKRSQKRGTGEVGKEVDVWAAETEAARMAEDECDVSVWEASEQEVAVDEMATNTGKEGTSQMLETKVKVFTGVSVSAFVLRRWARCSGVNTLARLLCPVPLPPDRCLITSSACCRVVSFLTSQKSRSLSGMDMLQNGSGARQSRTSESVSLSSLQNTEVSLVCTLRGGRGRQKRSKSPGIHERTDARSRHRNGVAARR